MHQGERDLSGIKGFLGQTYHHGGVLADGVEHHGIFKFGSHLANDVDGFGFEFAEVVQRIF